MQSTLHGIVHTASFISYDSSSLFVTSSPFLIPSCLIFRSSSMFSLWTRRSDQGTHFFYLLHCAYSLSNEANHSCEGGPFPRISSAYVSSSLFVRILHSSSFVARVMIFQHDISLEYYRFGWFLGRRVKDVWTRHHSSTWFVLFYFNNFVINYNSSKFLQ